MAGPAEIVIGFDIHAPYHVRTLSGLTDYAVDHGRPWVPTPPSGLLPNDDARLPAGVITQHLGPVRELVDRGVPTVLLGFEAWRSAYPRVISDAAAAGQVIARHFADRGIRRVLSYTTGEPHAIYAHLRSAAFMRTAREAGCDVRCFYRGPRTIGRPWRVEGEIADLADLLSAEAKPLGVMAVDNEHGWRAVTACRIANLRMPDQVALACAGEDQGLFEATQPSVSCVAQDTHRVGYEAARMLDIILQGGVPPSLKVVPPIGLIERASTDVFAHDDADVVAALRYIWRHVADRVSIDDLLEHVHISASTLTRKFRATLGRTPAEEIKRSRVEAARRLLTTTDMPLARVAIESGIGSQSQLSQYIRQSTGLTPQQLRKRELWGR